MNKPVVLWTCDVPGWAYWNRIKTMEKVLPDYEHRILFFGSKMPLVLQAQELRNADIIVCQGVKAMRVENLVHGCLAEKGVGRLDSVRVDINGRYVDIFTKEGDRPVAGGSTGLGIRCNSQGGGAGAS